MIPLITSIPPVMKRQASDGADISHEYALNCIQSWRNSGFDPYTVNSERETVPEIANITGVRRIIAKRDAGDQFGKSLVFFRDLISVACAVTDGPVVITNADILIDMPESTRLSLEALKPGQCLISKRLDIRDMHSREGRVHMQGYDFFAFHTRDLETFSCDEFIFGLPWWDYYLPLSMHLRGLQSLHVDEPFAFHLVHTERWDADIWIAMGKRFVTSIEQEDFLENSLDGTSSEYLRQFAHMVTHKDDGLNARLRSRWRRLTEYGKFKDDVKTIARVADLSLGWLDGCKARR